jgi:hypothetical protein
MHSLEWCGEIAMQMKHDRLRREQIIQFFFARSSVAFFTIVRLLAEKKIKFL